MTTAKPEGTEIKPLPCPEAVHKVCEYLGNNDLSGHCQKCPRKVEIPNHGSGMKMCYSLAEETILKVWDACGSSAPPASVSERAKAAAEEMVSDEVTRAVRSLRQDVRPFMRHLDDCTLVAFRKGDHPLDAKVPKCNCGLEKVLWDIPAEIQTGKTL